MGIVGHQFGWWIAVGLWYSHTDKTIMLILPFFMLEVYF